MLVPEFPGESVEAQLARVYLRHNKAKLHNPGAAAVVRIFRRAYGAEAASGCGSEAEAIKLLESALSARYGEAELRRLALLTGASGISQASPGRLSPQARARLV